MGNPLASLPTLTSINGKLSIDGGHPKGDGSCPEAAAVRASDCLAIGEHRDCLVVAAEHG